MRMTKFTLRPAKRSDIHRLAEIAVAAFGIEKTDDYMMPHRAEYPTDYFRYYYDILIRDLYTPGTMLLVVVYKEKVVVAFASWRFWNLEPESKGGKQSGVRLEKRGFIQRFWRMVLPLRRRFYRRFYPNRCFDGPEPEDTIGIEDSRLTKVWRSKYPVHWHLELLATHPTYQRWGAAKMLVKWGIEQANKDGVATGLESIPGPRLFYRKLGYLEQLADFVFKLPYARWTVLAKPYTSGELNDRDYSSSRAGSTM